MPAPRKWAPPGSLHSPRKIRTSSWSVGKTLAAAYLQTRILESGWEPCNKISSPALDHLIMSRAALDEKRGQHTGRTSAPREQQFVLSTPHE